MAAVVIFVDALPYAHARQMNSMTEGWSVLPIAPSLGYSVTLHHALFRGLTPDDLGYFSEWVLESNDSRLSRLLKVLAPVGRVAPFLDRGIHVLLRKYMHYDCANIPFNLLPYFARRGEYALHTSNTLFGQMSFVKILAGGSPYTPPQRDEWAFAQTIKSLREGTPSLFVGLADLDAIGHRHGVDSPEFDAHLGRLDRFLNITTDVFLDRHPEGQIHVISDHGMANAFEGIDLKLDQAFGNPSLDRVMWFTDAVTLRVWTHESAHQMAVDYLRGIPYGSVVTEEERAAWGVTNRRHGDILFVLNEGFAFAPSFFGLRLHKAYHGYHPSCESQLAVLASRGMTRARSYPTTLKDVHRYLAIKLRRESEEQT